MGNLPSSGRSSSTCSIVAGSNHGRARGVGRFCPEAGRDVAHLLPILRGAAASLGQPVDRHRRVVLLGSYFQRRSEGPRIHRVLWAARLLYRRGQGAADRLCFPAGGGLRVQVLREPSGVPCSALAAQLSAQDISQAGR